MGLTFAGIRGIVQDALTTTSARTAGRERRKMNRTRNKNQPSLANTVPSMIEANVSFREVLPVITALVGALVGGVVAELRTFMAAARERKKALRVLLYELLRLRFEIHRYNPDHLIQALSRMFMRRFGAEGTKAIETPEVKTFFNSLIHGVLQTMQAEFSSKYNNAVEALAPHDPITAYRLVGQEQLLALERTLGQYYEVIRAHPEIATDPEGIRFLDASKKAMFNAAYAEAVKQLSEDITHVARQCSFWTKQRVVGVLSRQDRPPEKELDDFIDRLLNQVLKEIPRK